MERENEEIQDVEVIEHDTVTVKDTGKAFELVTACDDPEKLFLDKNNFLPLLKQVNKIARGLVADVNTAEGIGCDSEGIRSLLERLDAMAKNPDYWKESAKDAEDAVRDAKRQLNDMLASAEKAEADARELEELRKHKDELERIEREKREEELRKAQEEAARFAREKAEAEAKAKAMEEAKAKAEADKVEAERKATEAMDRLSENDRTIVNAGPIEPLFPDMEKEQRRKVHREALDALVKFTEGDVDAAKAIVTAIAKGQIPHVRIVYTY